MDAACHIALGRSIDLAIKDFKDFKSEDEKEAAGLLFEAQEKIAGSGVSEDV